MNRYAQVINGVVDNVIESETDPDGINGNWVACGNAGIGYTYDGTTFTAPVVTTTIKRYISVGSFFDRFGSYKWAILASPDASVQALVKDCSVRKYIDLDNVELPFGLDMLIAAGHAIDKTAILTAEITAKESV